MLTNFDEQFMRGVCICVEDVEPTQQRQFRQFAPGDGPSPRALITALLLSLGAWALVWWACR